MQVSGFQRVVKKFEGDVQRAREAIDVHMEGVRLWRRPGYD